MSTEQWGNIDDFHSPPQPVFVVGCEWVNDNGDWQGENEDTNDGTEAADGFARYRRRSLGPVTNCHGKKKGNQLVKYSKEGTYFKYDSNLGGGGVGEL